jgi:hypothetical protein
MATDKQTAANRRNAQKTTGPRTPAGKAASRFSALKHGIYAVHQLMFDEKAEDLAELSAEYHQHYRPANANEILLADALVHNEWRLRRMRRIEADLWYHAYNAFVVKNIEVTLKCTSGDAFATDSSTFDRLQRVVNSCERAYHRALKELHRQKVGQALSPANVPANPGPQPPESGPAPTPSPAPQPEHSKPTSAKLVSFRQNSQPPVPSTPLWDQPPGRSPAAPESFVDGSYN